MNKWQKTVRAAKSDSTLCEIARGVKELNRAQDYASARVGYLAFRDRATEVGIEVPNVAYWSILFSACVS